MADLSFVCYIVINKIGRDFIPDIAPLLPFRYKSGRSVLRPLSGAG
jgi:hypothetical protein